MFGRNSRYYGLETITTTDQKRRTVTAVRLRHLGETEGKEVVVTDGNQLDVISERQYKDATRFWHIADASSELEANELVRTIGRLIDIPEK